MKMELGDPGSLLHRGADGVTAEVENHWVKGFRFHRDRLERAKLTVFPHGAEVLVNCERYKGPGIAVSDSQCPVDQVAVCLPNGNTWFYPIESVRAVVETKVDEIALKRLRG